MPNPNPNHTFGPNRTVWQRLFKQPKRRLESVDLSGPDPYDYRDQRPFAAYCLIVRSVLSAEKQTIRAINHKLGIRAVPAWTMDALDRVADLHPGYIDKFTIKER